MGFLCLFLSLLNLLTICSAFPCSTSSPPDGPVPKIAWYFNTKSRYEEVNPHLLRDCLAINDSWVNPPSAGCRAVHLSAIIRHGTRYPTSGNIRKIAQFTSLVKKSANLTCMKELQSWTNWYKEEMDGRLVEKGRIDHRSLARRLVKSFPSLINKENVEAGRVKFVTSSKHRCVNSTVAFKQGVVEELNLQGRGGIIPSRCHSDHGWSYDGLASRIIRAQSPHIHDWEEPGVDLQHTINDDLMRFFDKCRRLVETVEKNKDAVVEVERFNGGAEMRRVQEKLADRLQLPYSNITTDSVEAAFYLCAYEFTITDKDSPWCRLFDSADGQVMEYAGDLKQFWKRGFGHDINSKASCVLFHDLFKRLDAVAGQIRAREPVSEVVMVQMGHAETLLPLITLLDLFKDDLPLGASDFSTQLGRFFRTGVIVPYAANLLLTLYDCPEGLRLQVRLNERPLALPGLKDISPLYQDVRKRYIQLLEGCDQETVCKLDR